MADATWEKTMAQLEAAEQRFVRGDPAAFMQLWSQQADVTIFGSFGGLERGWEQIRARLEWASAQYAHGTFRWERLSESVGTELAYTVYLEYIRARVGSRTEEVIREQRVTLLFRREGEQWRIVHLHVDPLVQKRVPD